MMRNGELVNPGDSVLEFVSSVYSSITSWWRPAMPDSFSRLVSSLPYMDGVASRREFWDRTEAARDAIYQHLVVVRDYVVIGILGVDLDGTIDFVMNEDGLDGRLTAKEFECLVIHVTETHPGLLAVVPGDRHATFVETREGYHAYSVPVRFRGVLPPISMQDLSGHPKQTPGSRAPGSREDVEWTLLDQTTLPSSSHASLPVRGSARPSPLEKSGL